VLFFNAFLARHDDFNDAHIEDKVCQGLCQLPLSSIPLVDLVNFLFLSSVFLDIVKVVIPPCAFCIQMQILYNAQLVGELSYFL
jgi:hypothetical protein